MHFYYFLVKKKSNLLANGRLCGVIGLSHTNSMVAQY